MDSNQSKKSLLGRWKSRSTEKKILSSLKKAPFHSRIPLSRGQQRLWLLQQLYPDNPFYNYCESYVLKGNVDIEVLADSLQRVFVENSILRSTYHIEQGELFQKTHEMELPISTVDIVSLDEKDKLRYIEEIISTESSKSFNLSKFPLVNTTIVKISDNECQLILNMHHIVTDKWSMGVLREELAKSYQALSNKEPLNLVKEIQYSDFAYWQMSQEANENQAEYWKKKLAGEIEVLKLPHDFARKATSNFRGAFNERSLSLALSKEAFKLAKRYNTTPYVLLLTTFYLVLFKYSKQEDILIGSPVSNRDNKQLENVMGFFNETVVLRNKLKSDMPFSDLIKQVNTTTLEAFSNKDVSFDYLVKELMPKRAINSNPLFQVMFLYHSVPNSPEFGNNIQLEHKVLDMGVAKFDLTLYVSEENGSLSTTFEYDTDLFHSSTIERLQDQFESILQLIIGNADQSVEFLTKVSESEKDELIHPVTDFNSEYKGIHDWIYSQVLANPKKIAVTYKNRSISYEELDKRASNLAMNLQKYTHGENQFIGLSIERSVEMIIAIYGILKAGCAYLPIDPDFPIQRKSFMLSDSKVEILLTGVNNAEFSSLDVHVFDVDTLCLKPNDVEYNLPDSSLDKNAYLIYTSGSSGKPKAVAITHQNIISSTRSRKTVYKNNPVCFLLMSSISFDSSKAGIFWTLTSGGELVIAPKYLEQDINDLKDVIEKKKVTNTLMLPTLYNLLIENSKAESMPNLKHIIIAGETCFSTLVKLHFSKFPNKELHNEYGPSEATVWSTGYKIGVNDEIGNVPIGTAIENTSVYLLDSFQNLVPFGAVGEIYIGGNGVVNGYFNRDELTQKSFINNPYCDTTKLYRTGDLGRYRFDGNLEFLGRVDKQVKIRGYRIELPEIERVILDSGMVDNAIVQVVNRNAISLNKIKELSHDEIISFLENHLDNEESDQLVSSIEQMKQDQRGYLLSQINKSK